MATKKNSKSSSNSRVRSLETPIDNVPLADTEKAYGLSLRNEIVELRLTHSKLCQQFASLETQFKVQQAELLKKLQDKEHEQQEWAKRTAEAHGIDVNQRWTLDQDRWTFVRAS